MPSTQVVLITGAAGNLGVAVAAALRARGDRTVLVERSLEKLQRAHGAAAGDEVLLLGGLDLADEDGWRAVVDRALARFGRVDALVHTVGAYRAGRTLADDDLATWDVLLGANLRTALLACRAVLPGMLAQGRGRIVTVASRDALVAAPGAAAYGASKAALLRMTEAIACECRGRGVTANCVLPGPIDTPQNRAALPVSAHAGLADPAAVAEVIAFLVSPAARAVSGAALAIGPG